MKHTSRSTALPAAVLAAALTLTACASDDAAPPRGESIGQDGTAEQETHNDADVEFATGMIPHHAQAIEMADMVAQKQGSPLTELAAQIKAAQGPEIETMTQWLTDWGQDVPEPGGGHHGSADGMVSAEDMDSLGQMNGADFDLTWLDLMIEHHEGAVAMAQSQVEDGQTPRRSTWPGRSSRPSRPRSSRCRN